MGKNLKGKELGAGIVQRKDGKYAARFVNKTKKRTEKHFDKLSEAKKCLAISEVKPMYCKQVPYQIQKFRFGKTHFCD